MSMIYEIEVINVEFFTLISRKDVTDIFHFFFYCKGFFCCVSVRNIII